MESYYENRNYDNLSSTIKVDNFATAEALVENYRHEMDIKRLRDTLSSRLRNEDENIAQLLNTAYGDYMDIATEMQPLIDSLMPSLQPYESEVYGTLNQISDIFQNYEKRLDKLLFEYDYFKFCKLELSFYKSFEQYSKTLRTKLQSIVDCFALNKAVSLGKISFISVVIIYFTIKRTTKLREISDSIMQEVVKIQDSGKKSVFELPDKCNRKSGYYIKKCLKFCDEFILDLKSHIIEASKVFIGLDKDFSNLVKSDNASLLTSNGRLICHSLTILNLHEEFIKLTHKKLDTDIFSNSDFSKFFNDKIPFSSAIKYVENLLLSESLKMTIQTIAASILMMPCKKNVKICIDWFAKGVLIYCLSKVETIMNSSLASPAAPMDLYLHQIISIVSFIESCEQILVNSKNYVQSYLPCLDLQLIIAFRENQDANIYTKRWKFGTYWNLIYRNLLSRRMIIKNEKVEFNKVYIHEKTKYWLKYTVEATKQVRWILGVATIQPDTPLPPSRCMVPLFSRCLYACVTLFYDYASYILSFLKISDFIKDNNSVVANSCNDTPGILENNEGDENHLKESLQTNELVWDNNTKPEHIIFILLDMFTFTNWIRNMFIKELFHHMNILHSEYLSMGIDQFKWKKVPNIINIEALKQKISEDILENGLYYYIDINVVNNIKPVIGEYLYKQTMNIFSPGIRASTCLYRISGNSKQIVDMNNCNEEEKTSLQPSSFVDNATKPLQVFLKFSDNVLSSVIENINDFILHKIQEFFISVIYNSMELIYQGIYNICENQITAAKQQLASIQKLVKDGNDTHAANILDPRGIIQQYSTDILFWNTKLTHTLSLFHNLGFDSDPSKITSNIEQISSYINLKSLLN
ncbi:hypothetical protein ACR3K2_26430 [Cryptosporidium serpentis]